MVEQSNQNTTTTKIEISSLFNNNLNIAKEEMKNRISHDFNEA